MKLPHFQPTVMLAFFLTCLSLLGCSANAPAKEADTKSVQEIAAEAMNSKGKLTKEQINALIAANAKCTPDKM